MIDSVLKGTGNSRFLKSAVPAGTSWADALAMLQAGTFPIDFNGINTEGFQQIGTPLNKANLLKDATAAQIGLPPSTTPDGMFQALGNTGELHVWRKTTVTPAGTTTTYPVSTNPNAYQEGSDAKPAGYTLGEVETGKFALARGVNYTVQYANGNGIKVNDDGTFNLPYDLPLTGANSSTMLNDAKVVIGKTIQQSTSYGKAYTDFPQGKTYFIPSNATTGSEGSTSYDITNYVTKRQLVTGYAAIPAGTTIQYLGRLGDKARVQVVSYVGTGTYGADNPNSLTFRFKPKMIFISGGGIPFACLPGITSLYYVGLNNITVTASESNTTWYDETNRLSWYTNDNDPDYQLNYSGRKYTAIAIG